MGYDKNLLVESIQNRLQNEVFFVLHFVVFIHFFCCNDHDWVARYMDRQLLHIIYYWTIGSVQLVAILELNAKKLW